MSEGLDSGNAAARLRSITSGGAVFGIGQAGLSGNKYNQFVKDLVVLNNGYAAASVGDPRTHLKEELSNLVTDCRKLGH